MKTTVPVKVVADLLTHTGSPFEALLFLTITIEDGMLTLGTYDGPDLWRAELKDLMTEEKQNDQT